MTHGQQCSPKILLQSLKYSKPLISPAPLEAQGHHPNNLCIPHPYGMQTTCGLALSKTPRTAFLLISRSQAHCEGLVSSAGIAQLICYIQPA